MRLCARALLVFAVLLLISERSARAATAGGECISAAAKQRLASCPAGARRATGRRQPAFRSPPPPRARANAQRAPSLPQTLPDDPRKASPLFKRKRPLLLDEIKGLARLLAQTPRKAPDRPLLLRRLADDYIELENLARSEQMKLEILAYDHTVKKRTAAAGQARRDAARMRELTVQARKNAIQKLEIYARDYPDAPRIDEILYQLAFEHEQAGATEAARKVYLQLIQRAPQSAYVPNAYLAFGELFFQEAQGDPAKWELAAQAYREVTRYPAPANKVQGYARYKLGYVFWNRGEHAPAMSELKKVIEHSERHPNLPGSKALGKAARRDLVPLYAAAGAPERAFGFFSAISGDRPGESTRTITLLGELGAAYLDTGRYREALALYKDLSGRDPGERSCGYQARIVEATVGLRSADKDAIFRELERQLAVESEFERAAHSSAAKLACGNRTAELLSETAMAWHLEAVGSGGVRGTGDTRTMAFAEKLYALVAKSFDRKDFARFEFPRLVREDWPSPYKIRYARADLLYEQQRWKECGPAFAAVAAEDPDAADTAEALYASALCYQRSYQLAHAAGGDRRGRGLGPGEPVRQMPVDWQLLKPRELSAEQRGMIEAFDRFTCVVQAPAERGEARDRYVEVKYARARTYFEAQHWEEAATAFRDITLNHADHDSAAFAGQLWLEALNVLFTHGEPKRPACLDDLANAATEIAAKHCTKPGDGPAAALCQQLTQVECDVGRKRAEVLTALADASRPPKLELYQRAAGAYLALWREHGMKPIARGRAPECGRMDEVVHNMARAFQAARLLAKAIEARSILIDERWGLEKSPLARRALFDLGQNYQAIADYARAADHFERYAEAMSYQGNDVDRALSDAVILRLGLGQRAQALKAARTFEQKFGARRPERAAEVAFALATHYADKEEWQAVTAALGSTLRLIDAKAPLDVRVQAHALLGRAEARLGRAASAAREYERVRELWRDPRAAAAAIRELESDPERRERRVGRTLTAVGEALFHFAEQRRAKVDALRFPAYRGPGSKAAVLLHINTKVLSWVRTKRQLIEEASIAYKAILDLMPAPPPRWVIAAGAQVGAMWVGFMREFRAAPVPDSIRNDPALLPEYWHALDAASEPQKQSARGAYEICLGYSAKFQYFDDHSRTCEAWLADNYKAQHHRVEEFHGAPTRANSVLAERARALDVQGRPRAE